MLPDKGQRKLNSLVQELVRCGRNRSAMHELHVQKLRSLIPSHPKDNPYCALGELMVSAFLRDFESIDELLAQVSPHEFGEPIAVSNYGKVLFDAMRPSDLLLFLENHVGSFVDDVSFQRSMQTNALSCGFIEVAKLYTEHLINLNVDKDDNETTIVYLDRLLETGLTDEQVAQYLDLAVKPVRDFINNKYKIETKYERDFLFEESPSLIAMKISFDLPEDDIFNLSDMVVESLSNAASPTSVGAHLVFDVSAFTSNKDAR